MSELKQETIDMGCISGECKLAIAKYKGMRTNSGCHCLDHVDKELRMRIERKLWNARKELAELRELYTLDTQCLRAERDEARAELTAKLEDIIKAAEMIDALKADRDHWCDMHTVASRERDEARAELHKRHNEYIEASFNRMAEVETTKAENAALRDALQTAQNEREALRNAVV